MPKILNAYIFVSITNLYMTLQIMSAIQKVPSTVVDKAIKAGAFAGGVAIGSMLTDAVNAAVPQASVPVFGNARLGLGDAVTAIVGTAIAVAAPKFGGETGKKVVDYATTGIVGGWAVNKAAQLAGMQPIFHSPVASALARARPLYKGTGGYLIPSQAYSAAPVPGIGTSPLQSFNVA